ncbi:lytic transglycosylase domain-containing protein [Sporosarcina limicola]|uniref:Soluble lytic murein transglycosylase-like protein n=1 Tax=Sporosarcina limicola TaxID=34101 RepID=A0A927MLJ8_9BACL|nr:lytic transglycosylase domain-containing protein [Sporosarcina limicola]MBE1556940.1 soluble lytic murein transglycosylase-like protein [Sporosarcina limicola]
MMDTRTMLTLMEINALQSFGTAQTYTGQNSSSASLFSMMLEDFSDSSSITNPLSSVSSSLIGNTYQTEGLRYNGINEVFKPSTLSTSFTASQQISSISSENIARDDGQYTDIIKQAAAKYGLPDKLVASVIRQESNFNNSVISHAGAVGLMQLMPGTAKFIGVADRTDPVQNVMGGTKYLKTMLNQFDGNLELALAAYNAGPGNVKKYGGIPPFKETQQYVKKVLGYFNS